MLIQPPHAIPAHGAAHALGVDPVNGLSSAEAARRLAAEGPNELAHEAATPLWRLVLSAAAEPFILILLASGALAVVLGEVRDGLLVMIGLIPIVAADVATSYRAERALEALRSASAPQARVRRDGTATDLPAAELVVGDLVLLHTGDVVPADLRLVEADGLLLDRSILTGESLPEPASTAPDPLEAALAERRSVAYSGTSVVGGSGSGVVVATGTATELGAIAGSLVGRERRRSPLQRELDRLVRIMLGIALALIAFTVGSGFARGQPAGANLLAGISAAIAAIPEEPPILLAVVMGLGAYRLLKRGVLVRRLNAEETLGAVDLILTDKTGTLTYNRLALVALLEPGGPITGRRSKALLGEALRAEDDAWRGAGGSRVGSFTRALLNAVAAEGADPGLDPAERVSSQPPTDSHPYSSVSLRDGTQLALGAPEAVLRLVGEGLAAAEHEAWHAAAVTAAADGGRLLLLARRDAGEEAPWRPRALLAFEDALRPEIADSMATAREAGIQAVVVTGDHPRTAAAIAREAGLDHATVVTGAQLDAWDDDRLAAELSGLRIVARAVPEQKLRLVNAARAAGRTVAVTGDGVNDAPALHRADVAVAMGSGSQVAREAADLVLGDDSFVTLMYGLREGRRIVDNVRKGLVFLVSTHVALLGFILIATVAGYTQPLLPLQILWMELFIDLATSVAYEREPEEPDAMRRPPRPRDRPLLTTGLLARTTLAGGFTAVAALVLIELHGGSPDGARWLAYTALVLGQLVRAYANRSLGVPLTRLGPNRVMAAACLAALVAQVAIPYLPPLAEAFHATPLDAVEWGLVALIALFPAALAELIRRTGRSWVA